MTQEKLQPEPEAYAIWTIFKKWIWNMLFLQILQNQMIMWNCDSGLLQGLEEPHKRGTLKL